MQLFNGGYIGRNNPYVPNKITFVGSRSFSFNTTASSHTVTLTSLSNGINFAAKSGDLVIISYASGRLTDIDMAATGYTEVADLYGNSTFDINLWVGYKYLTSTDTQATITASATSTTAGSVAIVNVLRGVDSTTPIDATTVTVTSTGSGRPNPGAITPVTKDALIFVAGAGGGQSVSQSYNTPDLLKFNTNWGLSTSSAIILTGIRYWNGSGAFDPGAFTAGGTDAATRASAAATLAIRPTYSGSKGIFNLNAEAYGV